MESGDILIVEGANDVVAITALLKSATGAQPQFKFFACGGKEKVKEAIKLNIKIYENIGIIVDADQKNAASSYQSIRDFLKLQGIVLPRNLSPEGVVFATEDEKKIGVWVMPNNADAGMIETFLKDLVHKNKEIISIIDKILSDLEEKKVVKYGANRRHKALMYTWLAWQKYPLNQWQHVFDKKYLTTDTETCTAFVAWLNRLFNPAD